MRHYQLGNGKWVFVDWMGVWAGYGTDQTGRNLPHGFLMPYGIELVPHKPRIEENPVLVPEHPWEAGGLHCWNTFLEDQGRFRCWYHVRLHDDVGLAYAESEDGVHWTKPMLGLKAFNGSKKTNLVDMESRGGIEQGNHVFIDPVAPESERYKMVSCCDSKNAFALFGSVSPDGLSWKHLPGDPVILENRSDTHSIGAYDEELGKYIIFTRQRDNFTHRRGINRSESADFRHFPPTEPIFESTPLDPPDWDYYTNAYSRWPGAVDAHLMRFAVYHRTIDTVDVHLAVSRDGKRWHRPMGRLPWIDGGPDYPAPYKAIYASAGILPNAPGEWSSYICAFPQGHNEKGKREPGKILRAVSREDGVMSISAGDHGEFWTIPFNLTAESIRLNVRTGYSGFVRCALLSAAGEKENTVSVPDHPVPVFRDFTLEDCAVIKGDHVDVPLKWKGDLKKLIGKEVQLHFEIFNADLYAIKFSG
ncbi:hypothetical protein ACFLQL_04625 [Verrucomicrobiota bacterium]